MSADLHDLIRQLRAELDWARRTGIVAPVSASPRPAPEPGPEPVRAAQTAASPAPQTEASRESPPMEPATARPAAGPPAALPVSAGPPADAPVSAVPASDPPSAPTSAAPAGTAERLRLATTLDDVRQVLGDCTRCKLHGGRTQIVFGVGNPNADIMFVGEGPGADEDRRGEPFVGKAGQLLTRIIEGGMGIPRSEVYIANVVKCRPPNNRDPEPDEVEACKPFLAAQIHSVRPRVIVVLGRVAAQTLLETQAPMGRLRGRWTEVLGIPVMPTFHPAYLLRNPAEKRPVWEDIQEVLRFLGRPIPGRSGGA